VDPNLREHHANQAIIKRQGEDIRINKNSSSQSPHFRAQPRARKAAGSRLLMAIFHQRHFCKRLGYISKAGRRITAVAGNQYISQNASMISLLGASD